jgi:hypothetical protein
MEFDLKNELEDLHFLKGTTLYCENITDTLKFRFIVELINNLNIYKL